MARWAAITEAEPPPLAAAATQRITPAAICAWKGLGERVSRSERLAEEQKWYALECRIAAVKVEDDGDLHVEVVNTDGLPGRVVVEVPLGETWCELRKTVFAWTDAEFPLKRGQFKTVQHPVVTVIGRAFYDVDHAGKDAENNQRGEDAPVAVWEIHPVAELRIGSRVVKSAAIAAPAQTPVKAKTIESPSPLPSQAPTAREVQTVLVTRVTIIQIPYGETRIPAGTRVKVIRDRGNVLDVEYLGGSYSVPRSNVAE